MDLKIQDFLMWNRRDQPLYLTNLIVFTDVARRGRIFIGSVRDGPRGSGSRSFDLSLPGSQPPQPSRGILSSQNRSKRGAWSHPRGEVWARHDRWVTSTHLFLISRPREVWLKGHALPTSWVMPYKESWKTRCRPKRSTGQTSRPTEGTPPLHPWLILNRVRRTWKNDLNDAFHIFQSLSGQEDYHYSHYASLVRENNNHVPPSKECFSSGAASPRTSPGSGSGPGAYPHNLRAVGDHTGHQRHYSTSEWQSMDYQHQVGWIKSMPKDEVI